MTPLTAALLGELTRALGWPPGVLNIVTGDAQAIGGVMTSHPAVRFIGFTGSTPVGRHIGARCGERLIPCSLELGGKDPGYVRADADLDTAVDVLMDGAMYNAGQCCCGIERIYVHVALLSGLVWSWQNFPPFRLIIHQLMCGCNEMAEDHISLKSHKICERLGPGGCRGPSANPPPCAGVIEGGRGAEVHTRISCGKGPSGSLVNVRFLVSGQTLISIDHIV